MDKGNGTSGGMDVQVGSKLSFLNIPLSSIDWGKRGEMYDDTDHEKTGLHNKLQNDSML